MLMFITDIVEDIVLTYLTKDQLQKGQGIAQAILGCELLLNKYMVNTHSCVVLLTGVQI